MKGVYGELLNREIMLVEVGPKKEYRITLCKVVHQSVEEEIKRRGDNLFESEREYEQLYSRNIPSRGIQAF